MRDAVFVTMYYFGCARNKNDYEGLKWPAQVRHTK